MCAGENEQEHEHFLVESVKQFSVLKFTQTIHRTQRKGRKEKNNTAIGQLTQETLVLKQTQLVANLGVERLR